MFGLRLLVLCLGIAAVGSGCVSSGRYAALQAQLAAEQKKEAEAAHKLVALDAEVLTLRGQVAALAAEAGKSGPPEFARNQVELPLPVTLTFHRLPNYGGFQVLLATSATEKFGVRVAVIHHPSGRAFHYRIFIPPGEKVLVGADKPAIVDPGDEVQVTSPNYAKLVVVFHPADGQ